MEFRYFSEQYEPDYEKIYKVTRDIEFVVQVLQEALEPVQTELTGAKTNRAQIDALAKEYQAGMKKISTYVQVVLQVRDLLRGRFSPLKFNGVMKSLSLLLYSLAEIERCMHSGAVYTSLTSSRTISKVEGTTSLDVDDNHSPSMACRFLFRDFSFCLDLVQIVFNRFIFAIKILDISENPVGHQIGKDIAEEFSSSQPFNLFEWCKTSCRPLLKQRFLELGHQILQHPSVSEVVKETAAHEGMENLCEELREAKLDPARLSPQMQILEEPSAEPSYSLPPKVDFKDVQITGDLLGGGFGSVFQCKWQDKNMVVKIVPLDPEEPKVQEKFETEVSILSSLKHPNAVRIFGFGFTQENGNGFILMEQMEMDLSKIIRDMIRKEDEGSPVFPIDVSIDLMVQIVEGMCALECRRVMHRDLKPANILVNRPDKDKPFERFYQVKLADFGTSKQYDVSNPIFHTRRVGTVAYMAPEVMSVAKSEEAKIEGYSWKADVWSFGMVCSEILTAKRPFEHLDGVLKKTLAAIQGGKRPELNILDCGDPLRKLVEDCWKFNPKERPDISEVRQRLWECRIRHFFKMERPPTGWQLFRTNLYSSYIKSLTLPVTQHIETLKTATRSTVGPCREACLELEENLESIKPGVERIEVELQEFRKRFPEGARMDLKRVEDWLEKLKKAIDVASIKVHECYSEPKFKCEPSTIASSEILKSMQPAFIDPIAGMELQLQEFCKHDPDDRLRLQAALREAVQGMKKLKEELHGASIKLQESTTTVESGDLRSYQLSKDITAQNAKIMELCKDQKTVTRLLRNAQVRALLLWGIHSLRDSLSPVPRPSFTCVLAPWLGN